jgi:hypothetical protein
MVDEPHPAIHVEALVLDESQQVEPVDGPVVFERRLGSGKDSVVKE